MTTVTAHEGQRSLGAIHSASEPGEFSLARTILILQCTKTLQCPGLFITNM